MEHVPARFSALEKARAAADPLDRSLARIAEQIAEQEELVAALDRQIKASEVDLARLTEGASGRQAVEDEALELRKRQATAIEAAAAARSRLQILDAERQRKDQKERERRDLTQEHQRWSELERAFGRDGVQALLIEHALPELEEKANDLLDRLTNGEMTVLFQTQKDLKTRSHQKEVLDIIITDNSGERPYNSYSGGEKFRIDFAIRLALSQMLARRANTRLETLVIDEGFGSQDPVGRQRLIQAIRAIQDAFKRILVITHVDDLRDAFPVKIEVEKSVDGSRLAVV